VTNDPGNERAHQKKKRAGTEETKRAFCKQP